MEVVTKKLLIMVERNKKRKKDERWEQKVKNDWQLGRDDTDSFKVTLFVM